ncbi:MAG: histidine--tRNA ligase [Erysipelotrichaceae bacterium]|nr:histidine--tRNA ligase [Erysipelotrichaceae bacterium]
MTNYQTPRGTNDIFGDEINKWHYLEALIREICFLYHYQEIRTPIFEHTEVFKRANDSSDMVNKEMYSFEDNGGRSLTLKPEGTAGVVRCFVENKLYSLADLPLKVFYLSPIFRYERPQKGRMRIHHQFGVEVLGEKNPMLDAEVISLGYSTVSALGLQDLQVLINTLGDEESRANYRKALKEHFHSHLDTMCPDCQRRYEQNPLRILDCKVDKDHVAMQNLPDINDYLTPASKDYFNQVLNGLKMLGIDYEISSKLVRGLDYYTETVFEVISNNREMGAQSTIFGGGRYDKLVEYFGGPSMSGIGFGMGIERLLVALEAENITIGEPEELDLYIMALDRKYQPEALALATIARSNGFAAEMDYQGRSMKAQFKAADRTNAKIIALLGEDEVLNSKITLKNTKTKEQITLSYFDLVDQLNKWILADEHDHHEDETEQTECDENDCACHDHQHQH